MGIQKLNKDIATKTTQNDIKTDTSNILNSINDNNWSEKTFETNAPAIESHFSGTILNITGSGFLVSITGYESTQQDDHAIQIDGGTIYNVTTYNAQLLSYFPVRFNSSIKITTESSSIGKSNNAWVILD